MADAIRFDGSSVTVSGKLFEGDAAKTVKNNVAEWIDELADEGVASVRSLIVTKRGTGETAAGVGKYHEPRNSLYAYIRMEPGLTRSPGSVAYPAARRPYIINAVLAGGIYRGVRTTTRRKLDHFNRTGFKLRRKAGNIPESLLLRGL